MVSKQTGTFSAFYLPPLDGTVYRVLKSACAPFTLACPRPQPFCTILHTPFFGLVLGCLGCDNVGKLEETSCLDPLGTPPYMLATMEPEFAAVLMMLSILLTFSL